MAQLLDPIVSTNVTRMDGEINHRKTQHSACCAERIAKLKRPARCLRRKAKANQQSTSQNDLLARFLAAYEMTESDWTDLD